MKKTILFLLFFWSSLLFAQLKPIPLAVEKHLKESQPEKINLLTANSNAEKLKKYNASATDVTILSVSDDHLQKLLLEKPEFISINVPYKTVTLELQLYKQEVMDNDFVFKEKNGSLIQIQEGVYYRGIIADDMNSIVAISFFKDNIIGVASTNVLGNIIIGKSKKGEYITYSEPNLLGKNPFVCTIDKVAINNSYTISPKALQSVTASDKCLKIYYELTYNIFTAHNQNTQEAFEWLSAVHNNISTIYENDGIKILLHNSEIWTQPDPYNGDPFENIENFYQNTGTNFEGDLAHLVNTPETTSMAYLNSLCTPYPHAYSGASIYFEEVPVYSWTILAMTHEMGHSFGSPHTHDCSWNGNNTPIDGCGYLANNEDGCEGPIPVSGTIMSYCHLIGNVGTNFSNGFGDQPKNLMINTINDKNCVVTCSSLSVENFENKAELLIYPNPALNELHIQSEKEIKQTIITDLNGKIVLKSNKKTIDISSLELGTYIISIETNDTIVTKKLIKN